MATVEKTYPRLGGPAGAPLYQERDTNMDVLVSLAPGQLKVWSLTDRLGRAVGQISYLAENRFVITAAEIGPDAPLTKAEPVQPSLEAAMDEVAKRLKGVCQLSSQEGG